IEDDRDVSSSRPSAETIVINVLALEELVCGLVNVAGMVGPATALGQTVRSLLMSIQAQVEGTLPDLIKYAAAGRKSLKGKPCDDMVDAISVHLAKIRSRSTIDLKEWLDNRTDAD